MGTFNGPKAILDSRERALLHLALEKALLPVLWFRNPVPTFWVNEGVEAVSGAGLTIPADAYL